jgi:hypothetical protein
MKKIEPYSKDIPLAIHKTIITPANLSPKKSMPVTRKASNITMEIEEKVFIDDELKIGYSNNGGPSNMGTIEVDHVDPNTIT